MSEVRERLKMEEKEDVDVQKGEREGGVEGNGWDDEGERGSQEMDEAKLLGQREGGRQRVQVMKGIDGYRGREDGGEKIKMEDGGAIQDRRSYKGEK